MPDTCPTVRVISPESPGGFKIINEGDLTPEYEIWTSEDHKPKDVPQVELDSAKRRSPSKSL